MKLIIMEIDFRVLILGIFSHFSERITILFMRPCHQSGIPHFGETTITHILWRIAQKLQAQFS